MLKKIYLVSAMVTEYIESQHAASCDRRVAGVGEVIPPLKSHVPYKTNIFCRYIWACVFSTPKLS